MDAKQSQLEERLADLLKQTSAVAAKLQAMEQGRGTPHYGQIEIPAHEVGQRLSRLIPSSRAGDVAAEQHDHKAAVPRTGCPKRPQRPVRRTRLPASRRTNPGGCSGRSSPA